MNNAQFPKLLETPRPPASNSSGGTKSSNVPSATPALGSRMRSSIPMTPRSLATSNNEFARQLAAHRAAQQPAKKFRSSAAPKGTKFTEGYTDRAAALRETSEIEDEREERLKALQELVKEGAIEQKEYVKQTKLLGGDISSTHLVKGLDFALLRRVKAGENVMDAEAKAKKRAQEAQAEDLEDKLEKALESEVVAVERKKEKKTGSMAPPPKPKSRAELLAELKASRAAAKEATNPALSTKFKKITDPKEKPKEKEPEDIKVKYVMGEDGKVKRKVRRSDKERERKAREELGMPNPDAKPMGMMPPPPLPSAKRPPEQPEEDEDEDIFAGAGDYNPSFIDDDDSDDTETDEDAAEEPKKRQRPGSPVSPKPADPSTKPSTTSPQLSSAMIPPSPKPKRKIFDDDNSTKDTYQKPASAASLIESDPALAAALQRATRLATAHKSKEETDAEKKRQAVIEAHERDSYDIDMGFGGSTNFDDDDDEGVAGGGGAKKRKRGGGGGKKGKGGDKNSADVVGKIVEERYGKGKGRV